MSLTPDFPNSLNTTFSGLISQWIIFFYIFHLNYMMQKQQSLHELYKDLPDNVHIKSLVILRLDVSIHIHTQHFCYNTLNYLYFYNMPSELEVSLYLYDIFVGRTMLFYRLKDFDFQLKLFIQFIAHFQYFEGVVAVVLMVQHLQNLTIISNTTFPNAPEPSIFTI